jgi:hypothetical protein
MAASPIEVTLRFVGVLEQLDVPHLICGSIASSLVGEPRFTHDVDVLAELDSSHVEPLLLRLREAFIVSDEGLREAVRLRDMVCVYDRETATKVDLYVAKPTPFTKSELSRRVMRLITTDPERCAFVASPEDLVLSKLDWFRKGDCVSEQQWRDVLGVLKVTGRSMDRQYLLDWSIRLGLSDLLARALAESGLDQR